MEWTDKNLLTPSNLFTSNNTFWTTFGRLRIYFTGPQLPGNMTSVQQPELVVILKEEHNETKEQHCALIFSIDKFSNCKSWSNSCSEEEKYDFILTRCSKKPGYNYCGRKKNTSLPLTLLLFFPFSLVLKSSGLIKSPAYFCTKDDISLMM